MVKNARSANGPVCLSPNLNTVGSGPTCISLLSSSPKRPEDFEISTVAEHFGSSPLPVRKKPPGPSFKPGSRAAPIPEGTVTGFQKASALVHELDWDWNKTGLEFHERNTRPLKHTKIPVDFVPAIASAVIETHEIPRHVSTDGAAKNQGPSTTDNLFNEDATGERIDSKSPTRLPRLTQEVSSGPALPATEIEPPESVQSSASAFEEMNGNFGYNQQRCSTKPNRVSHAKDGSGAAALDIEADTCKVKLNKSKVKTNRSKSKASPKKPLTITARAIANAHQNSPNQESKSGTLIPELAALDFARLYKVNTNAGTVEKDSIEAIPKIPASRAPKKTRKPREKQTTKSPKLASPSTAIQHMGKQEFVFGTCSQNERDEESNFQFQLEKALRASAAGETISPDPCTKLHHPILRTIESSRNLMLQGARGDENLPLLPAESLPGKSSNSNFGGRSIVGEANKIVQSRNKLDIGDDQTSATPSAAVEIQTSSSSNPGSRLKLSSAPLMKPRMLASAKLSNHSKTGASTISDIMKNHINTKTNHVSTTSNSRKNDTSVMVHRDQGSDPPKGLKIAGSVAAATGSDGNSQKRIRGKPSKVPCTSQERPLKRNKKAQPQTSLAGGRSDLPPGNGRASNNSLEVDDIEDNESPTPSPPRLHPTKMQGQLKLSPARSLQFPAGQSQDEEQQGRMHSERDQQQELFALITKIVKGAAKSLDPKQPNWHEKILLYDPIILEDFTQWLNTSISAAKRNNPKDEVKLQTSLVQKWCQKNGVCCVWKKDS